MKKSAQKESVNMFIFRTLFTCTALTGILVGAALISQNLDAIMSIAAGTLMGMASFIVLTVVVVKSLSIECKLNTKKYLSLPFVALAGCIKMMVLGYVLWWLIRRHLVFPVPFMGGLTTMVVALIVEGSRLKRTS